MPCMETVPGWSTALLSILRLLLVARSGRRGRGHRALARGTPGQDERGGCRDRSLGRQDVDDSRAAMGYQRHMHLCAHVSRIIGPENPKKPLDRPGGSHVEEDCDVPVGPEMSTDDCRPPPDGHIVRHNPRGRPAGGQHHCRLHTSHRHETAKDQRRGK